MADRSMDESAAARENLSALVDGELDGSGSAAACASWRGSEALRRDWHDWQLIGDVLRSDDLATDPGRDARFLAAFRDRLAQEPVVLAPAAGATPSPAAARRSRWLVPSAMAAGFVLVVGVVTLIQTGAPSAPASVPLAAVPAAPTAAVAPVTPQLAAAPAEPQTAVVADGKLIRDARLDRYLTAHKQFAGSSALGVPSAFLRSATVESVPAR
jgi:sigma-E factor negative regulatory protein RseA